MTDPVSPEGLREALLPEPTGDGWDDEVRMTKRTLHSLMNQHIEIGYRAALRPSPDSEGLLRELAEAYHAHGLLRDHADSAKPGWEVGPIETCRDPLCVAALARSTTSESEP